MLAISRSTTTNGANEQFNTANYLQMRNQQPARALQVTVVYRF